MIKPAELCKGHTDGELLRLAKYIYRERFSQKAQDDFVDWSMGIECAEDRDARRGVSPAAEAFYQDLVQGVKDATAKEKAEQDSTKTR